MIDWMQIVRFLAATLPFFLLTFLFKKANLKKEFRSRQFLMPLLAPVLCIIAMFFLTKLYAMALGLVQLILALVRGWLPQAAALIDGLNIGYLAFFACNFVLLLAYIIVKRILITIFRHAFKTGNGFYETLVSPFYEYNSDEDVWFIYNSHMQLRGLMKALFWSAVGICCALMVVCMSLYAYGVTSTAIFYPVFPLIIVGELYFFLDGLTLDEWKHRVTAEEDDSSKLLNYSLMREKLRKLFPDKLCAESTKANESLSEEPMESILERLAQSEDPVVETYGSFLQRRYDAHEPIDRDYLFSGIDLLQGKSLLFNNPFYWDLTPYLFYPMQRTLLRNKKVLLVLGRNGTEDDVCEWVRQGLISVDSTPDLWSVEVLRGKMETFPDVGVITRSNVHNQKLHEACTEFFTQAEFAVVLEPSKLLTTAQIGLNSIAKRMQGPTKTVTWCGVDKNCDGLVDALSHALLADISEVSATERHTGMSSYMLWDADHDHLQHRLLPNISRYLGFGTELSFAALKYQIDQTAWYGGEAFPVNDMHWIAKQYYYDLLNYAELPVTQQMMDEKFVASHNLWNAPASKNAYLTVEDEICNMFEMRRAFSTRATEQGFVNILSGSYLLKDYMAGNAEIFETDPKAIPHIVADYVRSERNVALRMILMMSGGFVREEDLKKELYLIGADDDSPVSALWEILCRSVNPIGTPVTKDLILPGKRGIDQRFDAGVICSKQKFDLYFGKVFTLYYIEDADFIRAVVSELQNADCIAEDEKGQTHFLGSELRGHIFQKHLPGQFFTMDGKYYEMLSVTPRGQMLVRRAADHISGRTCYRQERNYRITAMRDSDAIGAVREINGLKITRAFADVSVDTPAYWQMDRLDDFAGGKRVAVNNIPTRVYRNKQILRLELPEKGLTDEIRYTLAMLFNETFLSLFAENQPYLAVAMPGSEAFGNHPLTYTISGDGVDLGQNSIYIIEDSQLDLGLLVSVDRCLKRIFETLCDYLDWHTDTLERSINPPPEPETPDFRVQEMPEDGIVPDVGPEKTRNPFKLIGRGIKKVFKAIADFFRKLFGRKKSDPKPPEAKPVDDVAENGPENGPEQSPAPAEAPGSVSVEAQEPADLPSDAERPDDPSEPETADETPSEPETADETPSAGETADAEADEAQAPPENDEEAAVTDALDASSEAEPVEEPAPEAEADSSSQEEPPMLFSVGRRMFADTEIPEPTDAPETDAEELPEGEMTEGVASEGLTTAFESDEAITVHDVPVRKPYHERYFLLFGYAEQPKAIDASGTLDYLRARGYGDNALKQARDNRNTSELIERGLSNSSSHQCDFCGRPLSGMEHEVLADGRERCTICSRSAVRTAEEFNRLLAAVMTNMTNFYGIEITAPVHVQMVNAKKLHRKLGKSFVPTGNADGRVLGVAIKDREGYSILVENGAPRIQTAMTLAHELTHIWQYLNWSRKAIVYQYGKEQELEVYEGMAKWVEIQYAYLIGESGTAKREELLTALRQDEYGKGFLKYLQRYPLKQDFQTLHNTPFEDPQRPL